MKVSVIIPTFNRAALIGRAIESVINQTYADVELVIVDDGSTDNTVEVVERFRAKAGSRVPVRYYKKENGGCASARNRGIKESKGDAVLFLDSDDQLLTDALTHLMGALKVSGADFAYSPAIEAYEDNTEMISYPAAAGSPELFAVEHFKNFKTSPGAVIYRRRIFDKVKEFSEALTHNEDSDFLQRVAICFKAAYSPVPSVKVFHHRENKSNNRVAIFRAAIKIVEAIPRDFPEFSVSLGDIAESRLNELRNRLTEALILSGDFSGAEETAKQITALEPLLNLSLRCHSQLPVEIFRLFKRAVSKAKRLIKVR